MDNYLLLTREKEIEELSTLLGFTQTYFLEKDLVVVKGTLKEIVLQAREAHLQKKLVLFEADTEDKLRFVLEKSPVDIILGAENIFNKDSPHYPKSGIDQILAKIAASQGKGLGFSISKILNAKNRAKLMHRMAFNLRLCQKYKVKVVFGNFSREKWEMRSSKDIEAVRRVLEQL